MMVSSSLFKRLPPERMLSGVFAEALEKVANCTQCGECEERCPYHLPIREMVAEQFEWYQEQKKKYQ